MQQDPATNILTPVPPPPHRPTFSQASWLLRWDGAAVNTTDCIRGIREVFDASRTYWVALEANVLVAVVEKKLEVKDLERLKYVKGLRSKYLETERHERVLNWLTSEELYQVMRWFKECFLALA